MELAEVDETKKRGRPAFATVRLTFYLSEDSVRQLDELAGVLNVPRGPIIAQAISKWYHTEPLIEKARHNGDGNT
jgi:predicted transcriptional regulator